MGTALIGLLGVVVGGVLTGLVQGVAQWLRERAEARAAIRLLHLELLDAKWVLSTSLEHDDAARLKGAIPVERWSQFSGLIAKKASGSRWRVLAAAYGPLVALRADSEFNESRAFLPEERKALEQYRGLVASAEGALRNEALAGTLEP
jgi:hypothetical protein